MPRGGFRPGSGKPKGHLAKHTLEIRDAARKHGPEMLKELVRLAKNARMEQNARHGHSRNTRPRIRQAQART